MLLNVILENWSKRSVCAILLGIISLWALCFSPRNKNIRIPTKRISEIPSSPLCDFGVEKGVFWKVVLPYITDKNIILKLCKTMTCWINILCLFNLEVPLTFVSVVPHCSNHSCNTVAQSLLTCLFYHNRQQDECFIISIILCNS